MLPFETWTKPATLDVVRLGIAGAFLLGGYVSMIVAMRNGEVSAATPFRYTGIARRTSRRLADLETKCPTRSPSSASPSFAPPGSTRCIASVCGDTNRSPEAGIGDFPGSPEQTLHDPTGRDLHDRFRRDPELECRKFETWASIMLAADRTRS